MTIREKIARALLSHLDGGTRWDDIEDVDREFILSQADAVLDAIREPTKGMIAAGRQKAVDQSYGTHFPSNDNIAALFAAMIAAAKELPK